MRLASPLSTRAFAGRCGKSSGVEDEVDPWHDNLIPTDRAHLNNPIDVWDRFLEDHAKGKTRASRERPATKHRREYVSLLEQMEALQHAKDASDAKSDLFEATMIELVKGYPLDALTRLSDDVLRTVFATLPHDVQDDLHDRLFPKSRS